MSDEQMRGLRSVFERTREPDDTAELVRPRPGGGLSGLSALARESSAEVIRDESPLEQPVQQPVALLEDVSDRPLVRVPQPGERRRKTSFSLPEQLRDRLSVAYTRDRWTIAALIDVSLQRVETRRIASRDIERSVQDLGRYGSSAIKSLKLTDDELVRLDALAEQLRLSRSQVMCALLSLTLDSL